MDGTPDRTSARPRVSETFGQRLKSWGSGLTPLFLAILAVAWVAPPDLVARLTSKASGPEPAATAAAAPPAATDPTSDQADGRAGRPASASGAPATHDEATTGPAAATAPAKQRAVHADTDGDKVFDDLEARLAGLSPEQTTPVIAVFSTTLDNTRLAALRTEVGPFDVTRSYTAVPGVATTLQKRQIEALARSGALVQVEEDRQVQLASAGAQASFGVKKAAEDFGLYGDAAGDGLKTYSSADSVVAVIDSGIDGGHVNLDEGKVIAFQDMVRYPSSTCAARPPAGTPFDQQGHGTHVASIIAGDGDGDPDGRGVAPGAALIGLRVFDCTRYGSMSDVNAAIQWVIDHRNEHGIDAMNLSLGADVASDGKDLTSRLLNVAATLGVASFVAAGNSGPNAATLGSPAGAKYAVTVGAIADTGANGFSIASFSSRGPTTDGRMKPDILAPGVDIRAADYNTGSGYTAKWGTSMATPFAAGVGVLALEADASLRPSGAACPAGSPDPDCGDGVIDAFMQHPLLALLRDTAVDWGAPGADPESGAGRLDAFKALAQARGDSAATPPAVPAHFTVGGTVAAGAAVTWPLTVDTLDWPLAVTALAAPGLDVHIGLLTPAGDGATGGGSNIREDSFGYRVPATGRYALEVTGKTGSGAYRLDISGASVPPAPVAYPGVPGSVKPTAIDGGARVTWTAAPSNGNTITSYTVSARESQTGLLLSTSVSVPGTARSANFTGLVPDRSYVFYVRAANSAGNGRISAPSTGLIVQTVPAAPVNVAATGGNASATVTWAAPPYTPGSGYLAGYVVRASNGATVRVGVNDRAATVPNLANGTPYTFTVATASNVGDGPPSAATAAVTPAPTVPGPPTSVAATRIDRGVKVTWRAAPANGTPVTAYTLRNPFGGPNVTVPATATTATLTGLQVGSGAGFGVYATNAVGNGPVAYSNPVMIVTVPGIVRDLSAAPGNGSVRLTWAAPAFDGLSPVTGYTVRASNGATVKVSATTLSATVGGLANGTAYTFTVAAANAVGEGWALSLPAPVTPVPGVPGAPGTPRVTVADHAATVTWTAAAPNGSPVTGYTVTAQPEGLSVTVPGSALTATVRGLTVGTAYTFTVQAMNTVGAGPVSAPSARLIAAGLPGTPTAVAAAAGTASVRVTWAPPLDSGGSAVTAYLVRASNGVTVRVLASARAYTFSGLTNGVAYTFSVTAVTAVGSGQPGETAAVVPTA